MIINLGSEQIHSWKFWTKNPRNCEMCGEEYSTNVMNERNCSERCFEYNLLYDQVKLEISSTKPEGDDIR